MFGIKIPDSWDIPENQATPEEVYLNRRKFIGNVGKFGVNALALYMLPNFLALNEAFGANSGRPTLTGPAGKESFLDLRSRITAENLVSRYNNFDEFGTSKENIWRFARELPVENWTIRVEGLVRKPRTLDLEKLLRQVSLEERIYRLRCVETWSAIIPWTGFPLQKLIKILDPLSTARYVKFKTFLNPNIASGQKKRFWEPWPYAEGLSMSEAMHDLSFLAVGMYGHQLQPQNGTPIRLVVPWKYGFKSIKSIASIEFTRKPPETFWQTVSPLEYDFWANVNPGVPYARWDQRFETLIGQDKKEKTKLYNGYARQVGELYA
ncbi:MAG: protein-methionine-sulfoxide reductase catalytic subunit MsrP [Nitrospinae bacterium]|nr:protein-methionine-sulfoxide reductase catalytic subunit MsrP [Nitrospinota bacterium]